MATTKTYSVGYDKNLRPDVDDMIVNVNPTKTPFTSAISKDTTDQVSFDWLETNLKKPGENALPEGADAVIDDSKPRDRMDNVCQILGKAFGVSGSMEKAAQYGVKKELEHQITDHGTELSLDIEWNMINQVYSKPNTEGQPRKTRGLVNWANTSSKNYYSFGDKPDAANHITHKLIQKIMQAMYEEGAQADTILTMPDQHAKISEFTQGGRLTMNADASKKKLDMVVNILETPFGIVHVMPTLCVAPTVTGTTGSEVYYDKMPIIQKDLFKRTVFRPVKTEQLAKTGDSKKMQMVTELGLKCGSKKGVGLIVNLSREETKAP